MKVVLESIGESMVFGNMEGSDGPSPPFFFRLYLWHMEVPRLAVQLEL